MAFEEEPQALFITLSLKVAYSVVGGIVLTLATVLFPNTALIGTSAYGYPFPWLSQPLYPLGGPMVLLLTGLIFDLLVWTVVAFLVITFYQVLKKK
ncbi:MAG: hypothetical protein ACXAC0_10090 [Candidatus Thorarchaeota archaeon]|jgi:hypothetical protein